MITYLALEWPDSGSWPEWLAGIAAVIGIPLTVWLALRQKSSGTPVDDEPLRRAKLVGSNVVFARVGTPVVEIEISNLSNAPIKNVQAQFIRASDGAALAPPVLPAGHPELAVMKPGQNTRIRFNLMEPLPVGGGYGTTTVDFTDVDQIGWRTEGTNAPKRTT